MKTESPTIVIGAGMAGLLAALFVKKRHPQNRVILVERSAQAGGDYREVALEGFGRCDRAMRVIYETGIPEFDELLHGLLPEKEWHVLPDNRKDVVGLFWRGGLQRHSPYVDLRRLPESVQRQCEEEILHCAGNGKHLVPDPNAMEYLRERFGPTAGGYVAQALEKLYSVPASAMHPSATHHPAMNRVVLYGEDAMQPVLQDDSLRARIAWPQQLTLPIKRQPPQCGLYPRRFGMNGVIDAALAQVRQRGVEVRFNREVASLAITGNTLSAVRLDDGTVIENPALVIAANGLPASVRLLRGEGAPAPDAPAPPRSWMVFVRTPEPPNMGNLYHFFCFDERFSAFRVTNYSNYCPAARNEHGYPLCVELWSDETDAATAIGRATRELREMNIVNGGGIVAQAAIPAPNTHALCSMESVRQLRALREEIKARSPENMVTIGPFVDDGVMLLFEVWRKMHGTLAARM